MFYFKKEKTRIDKKINKVSNELSDLGSTLSVEFDNIAEAFANLENKIDKLAKDKDTVIDKHNNLAKRYESLVKTINSSNDLNALKKKLINP